MSNIYGVKIPSGAELTEELGDGIVFSTDTCNHGLGDPPNSESVMKELKSEVHDGALFRDLDYWEYFLPEGEYPTLEAKHKKIEGNVEYFDFAAAARMASEFYAEQGSGQRMVANPVTYKTVKEAFDAMGQAAALDLIGMTAGDMLADNPKLDKGEGYNYDSIGLMLSPATMAGLGDMCPYKSWSCTQMCLNDAGQGETYGEGKAVNWPQEFRKKRTLIFMKMRAEFWMYVVRAIHNELKYISKFMKEFKLCVRMNVLSDVGWENLAVPADERNPETDVSSSNAAPNIMGLDFGKHIDYYDYTKNFDRYVEWLEGSSKFSKNYHLTFSFSEANMAAVLWALENGGSVATPFSTVANKSNTPVNQWTLLPSWWSGYKVIDGDISDMRFLDKTFFLDDNFTRGEIGQKGVITENSIEEFRSELESGRGFVVGLRVKGRKNQENLKALRRIEAEDNFEFGELTGGFVQYADWCGMVNNRTYDPAMNMTSDPEFVRHLVLLGEARRLIQGNLSGVVGLETKDFTAFKKTESMIRSFIKKRFDMESGEIREMALKLAGNLVRADNILFGLKYKPKRAQWTSELVKFLKQKLG